MSQWLSYRLGVGCVLALWMLTSGGCASAPQKAVLADPFPAASPKTVVAVTKKVFPAIVRLDVAEEIYRDGKRDFARGIGSGVIIDADGHVLTNFHVAGRAVEIYATLANKERVAAKLIGDDHWTDLAVVQLDMDAIKSKNISFDYAELGSSSVLLPGEPVMAIGTPFGLARTLTLGVVSNNERTFYPDEMDIDGYETGNFANWIQMDTPINPGNSGGPLVDMRGKVVGINTRGINRAQGLNFAIPIDTAKPVIEQILKTATADKKGRVDRSDLGINLKPTQDLNKFYDIELNQGVLIDNVERWSPAEKAGVKAEDILLAVNDKPINVRFPEEVAPVQNFIANLPIGQPVRLTVKRGRSGLKDTKATTQSNYETLELTAVTEKLQGEIGEEKSVKVWGTSIREMTRPYAIHAQLDGATGVLVTSLNPGYPAAEAELHSGDVIHSVNGQPTEDLESFLKAYDNSVKNKDDKVLLQIQRDRAKQQIVLKVSY